MDFSLEKKYLENLKNGEYSYFIDLYLEYFEDVYKYLARRIDSTSEIERILKLSFLEALKSVADLEDSSFLLLLYKLANTRVSAYLNTLNARVSPLVSYHNDFFEYLDRFDKLLNKLSLEEIEILRLKFFEELSDGEIKDVLNIEAQSVGSRIYRVLKRAHFILFGESDDNKGVYFGELSGFLSKLRENEIFNLPEALKIEFKADLISRIETNNLDADELNLEELKKNEMAKLRNSVLSSANLGSKDPAKVFVQAANELTEEEKQKKYDEYRIKKQEEQLNKLADERKTQQKEELLDLFDKWKGVLILIPLFIFVLIVSVFTLSRFDFSSDCKNVDIVYLQETAEEVQSAFREKFLSKLCDVLDVNSFEIASIDNQNARLSLTTDKWEMDYSLSTRGLDRWFVQDFSRRPIN